MQNKVNHLLLYAVVIRAYLMYLFKKIYFFGLCNRQEMFWVWYLVVVQPHVQLVKINIAIIIIAVVVVVVVINTFDASDIDTTKWKLFLKITHASIQCLLKNKT